MAELVQIVDSLENKISKLMHRMELLQQTNDQLQAELDHVKTGRTEALDMAREWEEKYDSLKMASSMIGSNSNKTEAKLKINKMIRELDHCIAQLSA
ncbi:MAG: hypothetical protein AB3N16_00880 [Flavobacteriaceae bacterium]